jgi:hypothetical protein
MAFDNEYQEILVTLKLDKNVVEVARILAICYGTGDRKKDFDNFISGEVTKIIQSLAADPPGPPEFPDSFKKYIQDLLLSNEARRNQQQQIKKWAEDVNSTK